MGTRERREARLRQYERPAFAAGMAAAEITSALEVIEAGLGQIRRAMSQIEKWQRMAGELTAYQYRRKEEADGG